MIGICVGILLTGLMPVSLPVWVLVIATVLLLFLLQRFYVSGYSSSLWSVQLAGLLFGFVFASCWGKWMLSERLPAGHSPVDLIVVGEVDSLPQQFGDVQRFDFRIASFSPGEEQSSAVLPDSVRSLSRVRLSWYRSDIHLKPGELWQLSIRLKPVHGMSNPGAADYEVRLFSEGIGATGYIRDPQNARLLGENCSVDRLRYQLLNWINGRQLTGQTAVTLRALLLGDKSGLEHAQWDLLADTGTVHLVVISGLHIGLVCLFGYLIGSVLQWLLLQCRLKSVVDVRVWKIMPALLLAFFYAALAGFSIPTQRALIMVAAILISPMLSMHLTLWQRFFLALTAVLLIQPLAFYQAGFWLSFGAVAVLIAAIQSADGAAMRFWQLIKAQWVVFIGLLPLLIVWLGEVSVSAPLVNLVAVPYVSFVLLPGAVIGCLLSVISPESGTAVLELLVSLFWSFLTVANEWLPQRLSVGNPGLWSVGLAFGGALLMVQGRIVFFRWLGVFLFVPVLLPDVEAVPEGEFRAMVIDVGQGLSVLVETRDHTLLYDTGKAYRSGGSVARFSVIPVLQERNLTRLDRLVISHGDNDHAGGYRDVVDEVDVGRLESGSEDWRSKFAAENCRSGEVWRWNGVEFRYIHPEQPVIANDNNDSCVLHIRSAGCSLMIPGDIEAVIERQIITAMPDSDAYWLIASHHGSSSSSTQDWLKVVAPEVVIFSAGAANRYGHPAAAVVDRVEALDQRWYNTASSGAVILEESASGCVERAHREEKKRYWSAG